MEPNESPIDESTKPVIRHIVISGGGPCGFTFYGSLSEANRMGVWDIANIQTIYGCSIGAAFAVVIAMKSFFTWEEIENYIVKRPWQHVFTFDMPTFFKSIKTCGLFDIKVVEQFFSPLFSAINISLNITLREFYEKTGIEIHFIVTKMQSGLLKLCNLEMVDISYKTHPEWRVVDAVYCSSALPILFSPYMVSNDYYMDGGFVSNYPVNQCIANCETPDEILGISYDVFGHISVEAPASDTNDKPGVSLWDYLFMIINSMWYQITIKPEQIKHYICGIYDPITISGLYKTATSEEHRKELIDCGKQNARQMECIQYLCSPHNDDTITQLTSVLMR